MRFDVRNAIEHGALKIELHHDSQRLCKSGVHADGELQRTDSSMLEKPAKRRQGLTKLIVGVLLGVVALLLRAEYFFHFRAVIEERKEDRNTLDDRRAQLRLDPSPVIIKPTLHGLQLR